ncbi:MAG TPA: hypothetical protein VJ650_13660, partial [Gemmatimonadaceae bacterium]|nr:hypothetical protein [Gemmatimonadaceae bacterium]
GRLAEVRGDTITVLKSNGLLIGVPGDLTRSVAVSRGKRPSVGRVIVGALSGVTASLLATAVIPGLTVTKCSADVCSTSPAFEEALFIGLVGGSLVGAMLTTDRWETVARPVRVGFAGGVRKARVGVALTF